MSDKPPAAQLLTFTPRPVWGWQVDWRDLGVEAKEALTKLVGSVGFAPHDVAVDFAFNADDPQRVYFLFRIMERDEQGSVIVSGDQVRYGTALVAADRAQLSPQLLAELTRGQGTV